MTRALKVFVKVVVGLSLYFAFCLAWLILNLELWGVESLESTGGIGSNVMFSAVSYIVGLVASIAAVGTYLVDRFDP